MGAGVGIVPAVSFLTTLTMVGIVTFPLEKHEFGLKYSVVRNGPELHKKGASFRNLVIILSYPELFTLRNKKVLIKTIDGVDAEKLERAMDVCPVAAIICNNEDKAGSLKK